MNYPKNYAVLAADEMEYTTGGSVIGVVLAVGGLAGTIAASVVYNNKLNQIAAELKNRLLQPGRDRDHCQQGAEGRSDLLISVKTT